MAEPRWVIGNILGIGDCAFWGTLEDPLPSSLKIKNLTLVVPTENQLNLMKWIPQGAELASDEVTLLTRSVVCYGEASDKIVERLSSMWDNSRAGGILVARKIEGRKTGAIVH